MSRTGDIKFVNFKVICMRDPYSERDMQMKFIFLENGTWFPDLCNGCAFSSGADVCNKCMAQLTSMFFHNPNLDVSKPITPQFNKFN